MRPLPPSALVHAPISPPRAGRALDVACGRGETAVWAARLGLAVVALDISPVAVDATRTLAREHGVADRVDARVHDLDDGLPGGLGSFDLVVCERFRDPSLWPQLVAHLRPGGMLAVTVLSSVGARTAGRYRAGPGELVDAFSTLAVETVASAEGSGQASLVAVKVAGDGGR